MEKQDIADYLDRHAAEIFAAAQKLYDNPEISKEEMKSTEMYTNLLKQNGFAIHGFDWGKCPHVAVCFGVPKENGGESL